MPSIPSIKFVKFIAAVVKKIKNNDKKINNGRLILFMYSYPLIINIAVRT